MTERDEIVTVYETTKPVEIGMVKAAFQQADIPFTTVNEIISVVYPVDGMAIVCVQVFQRDVERARRVLSEWGLV